MSNIQNLTPLKTVHVKKIQGTELKQFLEEILCLKYIYQKIRRNENKQANGSPHETEKRQNSKAKEEIVKIKAEFKEIGINRG